MLKGDYSDKMDVVNNYLDVIEFTLEHKRKMLIESAIQLNRYRNKEYLDRIIEEINKRLDIEKQEAVNKMLEEKKESIDKMLEDAFKKGSWSGRGKKSRRAIRFPRRKSKRAIRFARRKKTRRRK